MTRAQCLKCIHYHATWDPNNPRGCKFYGIKSASIPSQVVRRESGKECQAYSKKEHFKKKKGGLDLNDDSLW